MKPHLILAASALSLSLVACASAEQTYSDQEFAHITSGMDTILDALEAQPRFAPGYVVVVATADGQSWIRTGGTLHEGTGLVAESTSEFYIASMTKSYMGLLAAELDHQGILSLDSTLAEHWPDLQVPGDIPASDITLRDLITHQVPFHVGAITGTEANFRDLPIEDYPRYIESFGEAREPGFQYDNLGYNIYGAILELETGKNWRDWLNDMIFAPNGMTGTSGRVSDFDPDTIAWGHQIDEGLVPVWPSANGWALIPPKTDGMMQSAGGLMTTGQDFATWIEMDLSHEANGISADAFEEAQTQHVAQEGDGHGFSDEGYAYGWNNGILIYERPDASGEIPEPTQLLQHGGGYIGYNSLITIAPELGIGVAVAFNTEGPVQYAGLEISKQAFELALGIEGTEEAAQERADTMTAFTARILPRFVDRMTEAMADERWGPGGWTPDTATLDTYVGHYESDSWIPVADVTRDGDRLHFRVFDAQRIVVPMSEDIFAGYNDGFSPPEYIQFHRDENGNVTGFLWDEDEFVLVSGE